MYHSSGNLLEVVNAGLSGPDRIWVTAADIKEGKAHLLCVDRRDGKELWRKSPSLSNAASRPVTNTPPGIRPG